MKPTRKITRVFTGAWIGAGFLFGFLFVLGVHLAISQPQETTTLDSTGSKEQVVGTPSMGGKETKDDNEPDVDFTLLKNENKNRNEFNGSETKDANVRDIKLVPSSSNEQNDRTDINLGKETEKPQEIIPLKPICDFSNWRYDGCEMYGDARAMGHENNSIVFFIPPPSQIQNVEAQEWMVRSQSRKIVGVREVIVKSLNSSSPPAPKCTINSTVPALVFATGGLLYNYWHSFSDLLIPLFTTSRAFNGEIQFLITDFQYWFVHNKFPKVFKALTNYEIIDFDTDREVRCFPHIIVGLRGHKDLGIDPSRTPQNYDMLQFQIFLREVYSLPLGLNIPFKENQDPNKKPRMTIILRGSSRRFENGPDIVEAAKRVGFEVSPEEPDLFQDMSEFPKKVDSSDVLFGAHGAGLTNMLFLRANAILFQVVPWGNMKSACDDFYNHPAKELKLRLAEYNITAEESTLYEKYGKDSEEILDPERVYKRGNNSWTIYWFEQNLRLNITRFFPVLQQVYELVKE